MTASTPTSDPTEPPGHGSGQVEATHSEPTGTPLLSSVGRSPASRRLRAADREWTVLPWLLSLSGVLLIIYHLPHFSADLANEVGIFAILSGVVAPTILAIGLVAAGNKLHRSELDRRQIRRVCAWTVLGAGFLVGVGGISYVYQVTEGAVLTHVNYVFGNFVTGGAIAGFIVGWFDAHGHLRREELRGFLEAVEHTGHAVYFTRTDGTIEYVNEAFIEQTRYPRADALGETPAILNAGVQPNAFYEDLWATILAGELWRGELVNERSDGTLYHVDQTIAPVLDEHGTVERFVAINAEITELKQYEAELELQNDQLEQFASILSHDLRNPLNVATGRADLLASEVDTPHLPPLQDALDRMDRLVSDVLQLTRADVSDTETALVDIGPVARAAWRSVETYDASLSVGLPGTVDGTESQLRQLFENLFRNAIEHGGEAVTVTVDRLENGFYVADDGTGIPPAERDSVLETGYTTSESGTGLGLEIVTRIADTHDWETTITESEGGGARFEFTPANLDFDSSHSRVSAAPR